MKIVEQDPAALARRITDLQRQINELRSERRGGATSVDRGSFLVTDPVSGEIFRIGDMEFGDRGLIVHRNDGTPAFEIRKLSPAPLVGQSVTIYDRNGTTAVFSVDGLIGGLRNPYLEHPFQPVSATSGTPVTCGPYGLERTTSSASFETLFVYDGKRQNPLLDLKVAGRCSDGTTAGEVRVVNLATGLPLSDYFGGPTWLGVFPAGTTSYLVVDPLNSQAVSADAAATGGFMRLGVQVRRKVGS